MVSISIFLARFQYSDRITDQHGIVCYVFPFIGAANLKKILQKFPDADGDEKLVASAFDALEPLITAANIGESDNIVQSILRRCHQS